MNKKVVYARLHQAFYLPSVGDFGSVFPSSTKTLDGLAMSTQTEGLEVKFGYKSRKYSLLIPYANIVGMETVEEDRSHEVPSLKSAS